MMLSYFLPGVYSIKIGGREIQSAENWRGVKFSGANMQLYKYNQKLLYISNEAKADAAFLD
jgi:hypothetical protein